METQLKTAERSLPPLHSTTRGATTNPQWWVEDPAAANTEKAEDLTLATMP
jgi:hypothetical protein